MFSAVLVFSIPKKVSAAAQLEAIQGAGYAVNSAMIDNLKSLIGKKVYIHLSSGTTLAGVVKEIGQHFIHLEKLDKKDFFDALIRMENIIAIDTQFRKYK